MVRSLAGACLLGLLTLLPRASAQDRPDLLVADFEGPDYGAWAVEGDAFGPGPARGALPGQMAVGGFEGHGLVNTFFRGDDATGTLTSPEFPLDRGRINLLVGGGHHPGEACVNLLVGGEVVRTATGHDSEYLRPVSWDVAEFEGKPARIAVVDARKGGWGHINVDQIVQSDRGPVMRDDRDALLARADASTADAAIRVKGDPNRPSFHVLAPGNWINDPNGPIYYKGYYHLFYQYNPYGDDWGNMHWGHVRSKDLAHWEHLPVALWPSKPLGEDHVFSGCATIGPDGKPMIFYTSIGPRLPEQWAAVPEDDELIRWKKHPANPILTETLHGPTKIHEWRDPFVFKNGDQTYMVLGGNLNAGQGGRGVVNVYRAKDKDLTEWDYLGVLFRHPDADVKNVECPLFFPLDGRWALIVSQGRPVDWFVGDLDAEMMRFTPTARGKLDLGEVYAPNVLLNDPKGRAILWGWVNGFPGGKGWRHCMTLPRVLSIGEDGTLRQRPAEELVALREGGLAARVEGPAALPLRGPAVEVEWVVPAGQPGFSLAVEAADGTRFLALAGRDGEFEVNGAKFPVPWRAGDRPLDLRIDLDHSLFELYADEGRIAITHVLEGAPPVADVRVRPVLAGPNAASNVRVHAMQSTWTEADVEGR
jgi:beta-fructofuranosidase